MRDLTEHIQAAYDLAPPHIRRLLNEAFFEKLLVIGEDDITGSWQSHGTSSSHRT